jgi:glycosyltransferase involved in cell wall biosynthesis
MRTEMKPKKVLIISYYFPPLGMGGVQRVTKFTKFLPLFGWQPMVLTVKEVSYLAKDYSLLKELPKEAEIFRTGSFDPLRISYLWRKLFGKSKQKDKAVRSGRDKLSGLSSWFGVPDSKMGWIPFALLTGLKLFRKERYDLIFSSSPPPSLHLTGYLLKLITSTPWIADFRDPWIGYQMEKYPTFLHRFLKAKMEDLIFRKADRVITANPAIKADFERRHPERSDFHLVDQGYDEEDFDASPDRPSDIFTLGYLGTFSPDCDPTPVFAALGELISQNKIPVDEIKLVHYGLSLGMDLTALIEEHNLKNVVQSKGYLSHREALREMKNVSSLLLVTSNDPLIFPAKVFEYLRLKKTILGILPPQSHLARFLVKMNAGKVTSPENMKDIKQVLYSDFICFKQGNLSSDTNESEITRFDRKSLTAKLASHFNEIVGAE